MVHKIIIVVKPLLVKLFGRQRGETKLHKIITIAITIPFVALFAWMFISFILNLKAADIERFFAFIGVFAIWKWLYTWLNPYLVERARRREARKYQKWLEKARRAKTFDPNGL